MFVFSRIPFQSAEKHLKIEIYFDKVIKIISVISSSKKFQKSCDINSS